MSGDSYLTPALKAADWYVNTTLLAPYRVKE